MKFFMGFITATVIIALALTGLYAYKELSPNENDSSQTNEQATPAQQADNEQTVQQESGGNAGQTAPATIPAHENGGTQGQDMKQGKSDIQYIQGQYNGLIRHMKERAREGADVDELRKLQSQLDEYATQHADELDLDEGWEQ